MWTTDDESLDQSSECGARCGMERAGGIVISELTLQELVDSSDISLERQKSIKIQLLSFQFYLVF